MTRICAVLSLDNKGVNVDYTDGWEGGYPPMENLRILGVEWQKSELF